MELCILHLEWLGDPDTGPELFGTYQSRQHKGFWLHERGSNILVECDRNGKVISDGLKAEFTGEQPKDPYLSHIRIVEGKAEYVSVCSSEIDGAHGVKLVEIQAMIKQDAFVSLLRLLEVQAETGNAHIADLYKKFRAAAYDNGLWPLEGQCAD